MERTIGGDPVLKQDCLEHVTQDCVTQDASTYGARLEGSHRGRREPFNKVSSSSAGRALGGSDTCGFGWLVQITSSYLAFIR